MVAEGANETKEEEKKREEPPRVFSTRPAGGAVSKTAVAFRPLHGSES